MSRRVVVMLLLVLAGWVTGCASATSGYLLVDYRRVGGFAGLDDHLIIETDGKAMLTQRVERFEFSLERDTIARLQALLDEAAFSKLHSEYLPSQSGADFIEYTLTYQGRTVRAVDTAVPEALQLVIAFLNQVIMDGSKP